MIKCIPGINVKIHKLTLLLPKSVHSFSSYLVHKSTLGWLVVWLWLLWLFDCLVVVGWLWLFDCLVCCGCLIVWLVGCGWLETTNNNVHCNTFVWILSVGIQDFFTINLHDIRYTKIMFRIISTQFKLLTSS